MPLRLSLSNRLALLFFTVTLAAIAVLYLYVAPGLRSRLLDEQLRELAVAARQYGAALSRVVGSNLPAAAVRELVDHAALASGDRVSLLLVTQTPAGVELSPLTDSNRSGSQAPVASPVVLRAVRRRALETGIMGAAASAVAEAAAPVAVGAQAGAVVVFSTPVADLVRSVALVRQRILAAGALALMLALVAAYGVARALSRRVSRLERAAKQVAAGDFGHPVPVGPRDELGQVALAFNEMQRQLQELDLARKKFIATASHELRTPIFSLGGFLELLEDEELDSDTRARFMEQIKAQVARLRKLSVDLLDLSRLESGALELRVEQVDLGELTRAVSGEFEPALAQHDSHLELRLGPRHIEAQCDPVRVAQIVRILIDNALTHTPPGSRIAVTAAREDGHLRLAVRDDGRGIEPAAMRRIFEPFYTADDDAQGSGLGLAIASELAERMGGRLSVDSRPGETTFVLELPA